MVHGTRLAAVFLVSLLSSFAPAQTQQEAPHPGTDGKISLDVVVSPNGGDPMAGLEQKDFTILDNKAVQPIVSFQALGGEKAPVEVIVVVDAVNANFSTVAAERSQVERFLRANGGHLAHPTKLGFFTEQGLEMQPQSSTDGNALSTALENYEVRLRSIRRSSGIYGADERVQLSLNTVRQLAQQEAAEPERKLVLWISPGWPLLSGPNIAQLSPKQQEQLFGNIVALSTGLRAAKMTLYALDSLGAEESVMHGSYYKSFVKGVANPRDVNFGNFALQVLATQTGGLVLNSNDVAQQLSLCVKDAEAYYEITFMPVPDHGEQRYVYHQLDVKVAKPGLEVRTLEGYYAQP